MSAPARSHRRAAFSSAHRRIAFAWVAMLAVFLQAFVVQTHVHAMTQGAAGIEQTQSSGGQHVTAGAEHALSCALCHALATHGAAPIPSATSVLALERTSEAAILALALAPRVISHAWRSRAPPTSL